MYNTYFNIIIHHPIDITIGQSIYTNHFARINNLIYALKSPFCDMQLLRNERDTLKDEFFNDAKTICKIFLRSNFKVIWYLSKKIIFFSVSFKMYMLYYLTFSSYVTIFFSLFLHHIWYILIHFKHHLNKKFIYTSKY